MNAENETIADIVEELRNKTGDMSYEADAEKKGE